MTKITIRMIGGISYEIKTDEVNAIKLIGQLSVLRDGQIMPILKKDGVPYDIHIRGQHLISYEVVANEAFKSDAEKELELLKADVAALKIKKDQDAAAIAETLPTKKPEVLVKEAK